ALRALFQLGRRLVDRIPRLAELLARRGDPADAAALERAAREGSVEDIRDLQVASHLAWCDRDRQVWDPVLRELLAKGRGYGEDDTARLVEAEQALLASVVPAHRRAAERGQVELSTTPYYHPILP